jgi:GT2 family glycosyltransferase
MKLFSRYFRRSLEIIRNEGILPFFRALINKLVRLLLFFKEILIDQLHNFLLIGGESPFFDSIINKPDIICFPIIDWEFRYQRPQQILSQAASDGTRIFYIKPHFSAFPSTCRIAFIKRNIVKVTISAKRKLNIHRDVFDKKSLKEMFASINLLRKKCSIVNAIILVQFPFWWPLAKKLREKYGWKIVYDCMDEHAGFQNISKKIPLYEKDLIRESNLVTVTSKLLYKKVKLLNKRAILIPNATDYEHFHGAKKNGKFDYLKGPIIGYYGAISSWFDNDLVEYLTDARKKWNIILIGNTTGADVSKLQQKKNILLLGEVPYSKLPGYLACFDVCILPFKITQLTQATNPVKFYEMLSAGKPVVSVRLPELEGYKDYVYLSDDKESFLHNIETALCESTSFLVEKRVNFAKGNSWDVRYGVLKEHLISLFPKVSIIIVSYNNLSYTQLCLQSIVHNTQYPNYEIIIVDNASNDGTASFLREFSSQYKNVTVILNKKNIGFPSANNQGLKIYSGEYIVLLNNDTIVTRGWLTKLVRYLDNHEIGMVGPVTNFCGNEAKIEVPYNNSDLKKIQKFAARYIRSHFEPIFFPINMLGMFCVAMRSDTFKKIGFLDEQFGIGMFEDDDYSLRLKKAGYKLICAQDVFIHHFGKAAFQSLENYNEIFNENRRKFEKKWGTKWKTPKYRIKIWNWRI